MKKDIEELFELKVKDIFMYSHRTEIKLSGVCKSSINKYNMQNINRHYYLTACDENIEKLKNIISENENIKIIDLNISNNIIHEFSVNIKTKNKFDEKVIAVANSLSKYLCEVNIFKENNNYCFDIEFPFINWDADKSLFPKLKNEFDCLINEREDMFAFKENDKNRILFLDILKKNNLDPVDYITANSQEGRFIRKITAYYN